MIYICADDYGVSKAGNLRIDTCVDGGTLNKVSVFPNGTYENFKENLVDKNIRLSVHINLVEGKSLCDAENLNLITSKDGYFKHSFIGLLKLSLSHDKEEFKRQIYDEIKAQIEYWQSLIGENAEISIDSHQHTHMIPLIFKTLMSVIYDMNLSVRYLRFPAEPIMPYILSPGLYSSYKVVNLIKQWLLKFFGLINRRELKKSGIKTACFMGILFSGKMDKKRVEKVLPRYYNLAKRKNRDIELLFHPAHIEYDENELDKKTFEDFYFSDGRKIEFDAIMNLDIDKIL